MANKKIEQVVEDDDLLEASKETDDQQLDEFKADATGGEGALSSVIKDAEVPEPHSTGSAARGADKNAGESMNSPVAATKASVSKASIISQVMGKMNGMSKDSLQKLAGEVDTYGKNKLPASKSQSHGKDAMPKLAAGKVTQQEAIDATAEIFAGEELSEEMTSKAQTIFEATVNAKMIELANHMHEEYNTKLDESKEVFQKDLTDRVDEYLDYVTEEWMKENEVAIENALKVEVAERFMTSIKDLFTENYISVPEDKVDLVAELELQKEELEGKLEEQVQAAINTRKETDNLVAFKVFSEACDGLTLTQKDKLTKLSESIEYADPSDYANKIDQLKEHYFTNKKAITEAEDLNSDPVDVDAEAPANKQTGPMSVYSQAISRSIRK
tara:strand:- start:208 stop:1365 length:1158 start_codon:yes stop_codon:yes gene_type:complete